MRCLPFLEDSHFASLVLFISICDLITTSLISISICSIRCTSSLLKELHSFITVLIVILKVWHNLLDEYFLQLNDCCIIATPHLMKTRPTASTLVAVLMTVMQSSWTIMTTKIDDSYLPAHIRMVKTSLGDDRNSTAIIQLKKVLIK